MKVIQCSILALALMGAATVQAKAADADPMPSYEEMGFYLRGDIGWSFLEWSGGDDDSSLAVGGGAGLVINDYLRTDVRYDWAGTYDVAPGADMSISTLTGNLYFDIPTGTMVTPYLGGGAGYGWGSVDGGPDKDGMAYSLMAGASVGITDSLDLDVGYRYREVLSDGNNPSEHQVMTGFRFKF